MSAVSGSGDAYLLYHSIGHYHQKEADLAQASGDFAKI